MFDEQDGGQGDLALPTHSYYYRISMVPKALSCSSVFGDLTRILLPILHHLLPFATMLESLQKRHVMLGIEPLQKNFP